MRSGLPGSRAAYLWLATAGVFFAMCIAVFPATSEGGEGDGYVLQAGDVVNVSVWREPDLDRALLVRPDGGISFPLAGDLMAAGQTIAQLTESLATKLSQFIPDPVVTVALQENLGNRIYVTGRVTKPGVYLINQDVDVLQALAIAGGLTPFADRDDIKILRRENGVERAIPFNYKQVQRGERLQQNIILRPGDTVLVP
ncbi:MAG: polysaccharide biosynthesis/export family protein [Pseudomonadota bacterium]|nr:polysaccharide biosynthesis/export family protein [Pseudomonadota bacterium]